MRVVICILIILNFLPELSARDTGTTGISRERDTTFIKRPYYLGITTGYSRYGDWATTGTAFDVKNPPADYLSYREFYQEQSVGLELAFPFLRKWECEAAFEYSQTKAWGQGSYFHVTPMTNPQEGWTSAYARHELLQAVRLRSFFSYELIRTSKFAMNAGAGGWYSSAPIVGGEAGLKCYYSVSRNITVQFGATAGVEKNTGVYGAARVSVLLTGTRTYRARPDHYYVRTYEAGE